MSNPLIARAVRFASAIRDWGFYAGVLLALGAGLAFGGDWALRGIVSAYDAGVVRTPIDNVDDMQPANAIVPARVGMKDAGVLSTPAGFDHARPSPRLFDRMDESEVERVKASVSERVVAEGSADWYSGNGHTYTTICVRLCDGAHFPVSYSTSRSRFAHDERVCKSRCAAPARLFVYPNPGGSTETSVDRDGRSYIAMPTAFQFRKGTTPACTCRPDAWEEVSLTKHRDFRAVEARDRGQFGDTRGTVVEAAQEAAPMPAKAEVVASRAAPRQPDAEQGWSGAQTAALSAEAEVADVAPLPIAIEAPPPNPVRLVKADPSEVKPVVAQPLMSATIAPARKRRIASIPRPRRLIDENLPTLRAALPAEAGEVRLWGRGPNSVFAPRGNTAGEIFARNFY